MQCSTGGRFSRFDALNGVQQDVPLVYLYLNMINHYIMYTNPYIYDARITFDVMKRFELALLNVAFCAAIPVFGQTNPTKDFEVCAYWELIEQLRAYEDTLAFEQSLPDTLRREYGLPVTDAGLTSKMYRLYRCAALQDTLANLQDSLAFVRAVPPTVDSDSISGITGSAAKLHGRVLSDGGETVTERWFKYGISRTALNDTITAVVGVPDSIFTANLTGLTTPGTWYMAAVAKNAKGTSSGDTLQFVVPVAPTMDTDSISSITASGGTFHGRTLSTGGGALSHRWFRYGTSAAALNDSIAGVAGTPDSLFTASVTNLAAGTYYVAAFGKNVVGTSSGDTLQFVVPVAPTMDTDSISSTASGATFHGRTLSTGGAALSHRWFKYGTSATALSDSIAGVAGTPDSLFTASVTSLAPGTYYVAAFGKNLVGTSSGDTLSFSIFQCGTSSVNYQSHDYTTVQIGTQCWFKENLRASNYKDGSTIPSGLNATAWNTATTGAVTTYGESTGTESGNLSTYGRLYNWYAVTDSKGLCPAGWSVPDSTEWMTLFNDQGGPSVAGEKLKVTASHTTPWDGTNTSGFSALDGGLRRPNGNHEQLGYLGAFWSTTISGTNAWYFYMTDGSTGVAPYPDSKTHGFSVRCLKD
jgi:uncharacterized protein (TIGR02145 family)